MFETRFFEIIASIVTIVLVLGLRAFLREIIRKHTHTKGLEIGQRKYANKFFNFISVVILFVVLGIIWEVSFKGLSFYFASIFTIVGVALFANWSILSNITTSIILFFNYSFKIGSEIQIMDKDDSVQGTIIDITFFSIQILTKEGDIISYPNNIAIQKPIKLFKKIEFED
ncbi:mechanosensitive ion channel family protein [Lacihabitans sp. LS3-19]|uniref:mechanosensitive ion channel domain-containing protein n=1 Tax=Lacihabitans sp. LS3-19 TaxID=2487335 RepID=UPI0020CBBA32|nr:mechanosensitive ion channel domain-containing protein [Lacihabitans sp. LS3-19]MCP9770010.1 mechanosensitive ion channel family protein [Lacihabitans sp. LS3-19]